MAPNLLVWHRRFLEHKPQLHAHFGTEPVGSELESSLENCPLFRRLQLLDYAVDQGGQLYAVSIKEEIHSFIVYYLWSGSRQLTLVMLVGHYDIKNKDE